MSLTTVETTKLNRFLTALAMPRGYSRASIAHSGSRDEYVVTLMSNNGRTSLVEIPGVYVRRALLEMQRGKHDQVEALTEMVIAKDAEAKQ